MEIIQMDRHTYKRRRAAGVAFYSKTKTMEPYDHYAKRNSKSKYD